MVSETDKLSSAENESVVLSVSVREVVFDTDKECVGVPGSGENVAEAVDSTDLLQDEETLKLSVCGSCERVNVRVFVKVSLGDRVTVGDGVTVFEALGLSLPTEIDLETVA